MPEAQGTELGRGFWAIAADLTGLKQGLEKAARAWKPPEARSKSTARRSRHQ